MKGGERGKKEREKKKKSSRCIYTFITSTAKEESFHGLPSMYINIVITNNDRMIMMKIVSMKLKKKSLTTFVDYHRHIVNNITSTKTKHEH